MSDGLLKDFYDDKSELQEALSRKRKKLAEDRGIEVKDDKEGDQ